MLWDTALKGFGLRVGKDARTFIVLIGGGRRHKLGRYPQVTLAEARKEAKRIQAEKHLGQVKPTHVAFDDARDDFLAEKAQTTRAQTFQYYRARLLRHFHYGRRSVADIGLREITKRLNELNAQPAEKRHAFVVIRTFFNWCVEQHLVSRSPVEHLSGPPLIRPRERVLSGVEIKAVWLACPDDPFGTVVKLLMLTGQRRGEIAHISLDGDLATISPAHTKNKRAHAFPVGERARELLGRNRIFNGWGRSKARLDTVSGVSDWTLHDLRRTYATTLAELGTPPHVIEAILNHKSGIISGVAQTYNRFRYIEEMRMAVQNFEHHFSSILVDREAVPLAACHDAAQPAR